MDFLRNCLRKESKRLASRLAFRSGYTAYNCEVPVIISNHSHKLRRICRNVRARSSGNGGNKPTRKEGPETLQAYFLGRAAILSEIT